VIIFLAISLVVNLSLSSLSSVYLSLQEENYFVGLSYIYITASGLFSKYHEVEILSTVWKIVNIVGVSCSVKILTCD